MGTLRVRFGRRMAAKTRESVRIPDGAALSDGRGVTLRALPKELGVGRGLSVCRRRAAARQNHENRSGTKIVSYACRWNGAPARPSSTARASKV